MVSAVSGLCDAIRVGLDAYNTKYGFYQVHFQRKGGLTVNPNDQWRYYITGRTIVGYDDDNFIYGNTAFDESVANNILSANDQ